MELSLLHREVFIPDNTGETVLHPFDPKLHVGGHGYWFFEDVDEVEKTLVFYDKDGQPDDVDYLHVAVLCIGAIKELSAKINKLESKVKELERKGGN